MKTNHIFKGLSAALVLGMACSCSSDYLDTMPETSVSTGEVTATVEAAQLALNGLCRAMQTQYHGTSYNSLNGENYFNSIYNEGLGQDCICGLSLDMYGYEILTGGAPWQKDNYVLNALPWSYCYNLIQQANTILSGIDDAQGDVAQRDFVKAQALTFRAHGYAKLLQYYAPRWADSNNGETYCAVYRTEAGVQDAPLCTMNQVLDLIYSDCKTAVELYESSQMEREYKWQPDRNVVLGIWARAALLKDDWKTAQEKANLARQGYNLMSDEDYFGGFFKDNEELMWSCSNDFSTIYYWSWGAMHAVNGIYTKNWGVGDAIDYEFYKTLDENDVRRKFFLTPDKTEVVKEYSPKNSKGEASWDPGKITIEDWFNPDLVVESTHCNIGAGPYAKKDAINGRFGLYNIAVWYGQVYGKNIYTGNFEASSNDGFTAYASITPNDGLLVEKGKAARLAVVPFGAQFKFWSEPVYGTGFYPFMRGAEMILIEAEAAYHNGDIATATSCLKMIQDKRIPGYAFDGQGEELLNEIRKCRRIELWGEGFSWPDFKRWGLPIVRKAWAPNDVNSGNWMTDFGVETPVNVNGGWRLLIPRNEIQYNSAIDRSIVNIY